MLEENAALLLDNINMHMRDLALMGLKHKYFYKTPPSAKILKFDTLIRQVRSRLKKISGNEWHVICEHEKSIRTTKIFLHGDYDKKSPAVIFHHGAGQINYERLMKIGLGKEIMSTYNVFSIKAQHHDNIKDYLSNCMDSFLNWQLTFAGSVLAVEEIVKLSKSDKIDPIIMLGTSLGGIVASLHFLLFNTADLYFPFVAYPNVGEIFSGRAYKYALNDRKGWQKNKLFLDSFRFKNNFSEKNKAKVFPILAKKDWYIDFDKAKEFWDGYQTKVYDLGHKSIGIKLPDIHKYVKNKIKPFMR